MNGENKTGMLKRSLKKKKFKKNRDPTIDSMKKEMWKKRNIK